MPPDYARMQDDALRITDLLCRLPSVSAEERELDETAELVEELLTGVGFETQQLRVASGAPAVYGDQPGRSDFTLLLYNHYDVQPVDPLELWDSPPFEPVHRELCLVVARAPGVQAAVALHRKRTESCRSACGGSS